MERDVERLAWMGEDEVIKSISSCSDSLRGPWRAGRDVIDRKSERERGRYRGDKTRKQKSVEITILGVYGLLG